jgi:hypothetical protein
MTTWWVISKLSKFPFTARRRNFGLSEASPASKLSFKQAGFHNFRPFRSFSCKQSCP